MSGVGHLSPALLDRLWSAEPISLEELQSQAALHTRTDRKYVVSWDAFLNVLDAIGATHRVLEINGRRTFRYDTTYFDSDSLAAYRAHQQRRRRRYKVRTRHYVDSGRHFFEVKLKGPRGETVKHQLPCPANNHGQITSAAFAFLCERIAEAYPGMAVPQLSPSLRTDYERMTFAAGAERLTCDFSLAFSYGGREVPGLNPGFVILETKSERGLGTTDRELRRLGIRPVACSKYRVGVGLLREDVKVNDLRWLLSRYFHWTPRPGGADPGQETARA